MVVVHVNGDDTSLTSNKGKESNKEEGGSTHYHYQFGLGDQRELY
ncbi:hypothetical protein POREN0001_0007 [Porphyromonas endodontalis ATCC 35406]|jgi:hypothetical protein|uniref:Uncharacterized protein n=1 Tax=Porphyromonas endodontalis (strain ATCC 35406 / DSM 24491 / JCM 8526 / CCUG 16442 / BCRC 14492 / NCTC 13058 / HG 370) TaxID=553175 RepID=C3J8H7_POREA|nr:hypothetical protein POREN0001_0007 [Porphyromonas endodontalis ATCC 35406]